MRLWQGESFFLQLGSHHRFIEGWDAALLAQSESGGALAVTTGQVES